MDFVFGLFFLCLLIFIFKHSGLMANFFTESYLSLYGFHGINKQDNYYHG